MQSTPRSLSLALALAPTGYTNLYSYLPHPLTSSTETLTHLLTFIFLDTWKAGYLVA